MTVRQKAAGSLAILGAAGLLMTLSGHDWFGNYKSSQPDHGPTSEAVAPSTSESQSNHRHVRITYEHKAPLTHRMLTAWDFGPGHKRDTSTLDKLVNLFDVEDTVEIGTEVFGSASPQDGEYNKPEAFRVQIYVDGVKKCPHYFFNNAPSVQCRITVE